MLAEAVVEDKADLGREARVRRDIHGDGERRKRRMHGTRRNERKVRA